jgi:hypothetical protein
VRTSRTSRMHLRGWRLILTIRRLGRRRPRRVIYPDGPSAIWFGDTRWRAGQLAIKHDAKSALNTHLAIGITQATTQPALKYFVELGALLIG